MPDDPIIPVGPLDAAETAQLLAALGNEDPREL
jgi:hypothetical protein